MNLEKITEKVSRNVQPLDRLMGATESVALALVVRLASWTASIPNAVMVAQSAFQIFALPVWVCVVIAVSLELIGHAITEHYFAVCEWEQTRRKTDPSMSKRLALALVVSFYALDILMVFVLAWMTFSTTGDAAIFVSLAYPLFGIGTTIVTSERQRLFRLKNAVQIQRQDRKKKVSSTAKVNTKTVDSLEHARQGRLNKREQRLDKVLSIFEQDNLTPIAHAAGQLNISRTTLYADIEHLENEGKLKKNGHGVEVLTRG
jgi:ABC-type multidrug transport system fused ATPase/permease subunit